MKLDRIYYDQILNGRKEYEIRIFDDKRKKIKLLDVITFSCGDDDFKVVITELSYFNTFGDAIKEVGLKRVLPSAKSLKEGTKTYENIISGKGKSFGELAKEFGVVRIKFDLI